MATWLGAILVTAVLVSCGSNEQHSATPAATLVPPRKTPAVAPLLAGQWDVEPGIRVPLASAPATLKLADGSYRMYLPGLFFRSSKDGLSWTEPSRIALAEPGEMLRNPAVVQMTDRTFVMIYEDVSDEKGPNRQTRFYRATSSDGLAFSKTTGAGANGAVLEPEPDDAGFMSAPDIIALPGGALRLYYNTADGSFVESAHSADGGVSWRREGAITIAGFELRRKAADPDVIALPGAGGYRLFFAAGAVGSPTPRILSATSSDGLHFTLDAGERLSPSDSSLHRVDPEVVETAPGVYRMYFAEAVEVAGPYSLRSALLRED
ncbi:MAG: hypothetical protein ABI782_01680 [Anaerolineaceae bacterium]